MIPDLSLDATLCFMVFNFSVSFLQSIEIVHMTITKYDEDFN